MTDMLASCRLSCPICFSLSPSRIWKLDWRALLYSGGSLLWRGDKLKHIGHLRRQAEAYRTSLLVPQLNLYRLRIFRVVTFRPVGNIDAV